MCSCISPRPATLAARAASAAAAAGTVAWDAGRDRLPWLRLVADDAIAISVIVSDRDLAAAYHHTKTTLSREPVCRTIVEASSLRVLLLDDIQASSPFIQ